MGHVNISLRNGIFVELEGKSYSLDPSGPVKADYTFVSHAHLDHVQKGSDRNSRVLASRETCLLAGARGFQIGQPNPDADSDGVALLDSGHILGARAICIDDELLYTGDAAGRDRAFMGRCKTRKARVMITESTFGTTNYVFPPIPEVVKEVNQTIATMFDKGRPVVLMGYALGKSQVLSNLFSSWSPLYVHEEVSRMSDVYRDCGIALKKGERVPEDLGNLERGPWVMFTPVLSTRNALIQRLKKDYGAAIVAFSGWAADPGYRYSLGADYAFPLSDHCDYRELLALVKEVSPELVYTTHGFTEEFAHDLRMEGFDAKPLTDVQQAVLSDY
ncbi:MAG: exonuclease [Thaumarchaeota archaeon]|nr:exonuclease [Nitrososphaerota archaeon]